MSHERPDPPAGPWFEAVRLMDLAAAVAIARDVLARGSLVALEIDHQLDEFTAALISDPTAFGAGRPLVDLGAKRPADAIDEAHAKVMKRVPALRTVFVEDEYALRRDRNAPGCAFVDDRVLRWTAVGDDGIGAARRLRAGSDGVPLCAYLSSLTAEDVVSGPGDNLTSAAVGCLAASVAAIAIPFDDSDALVFLFRSACQPWTAAAR
jgi:hypothetical protein